MAAVPSTMLPLGTEAPAFSLTDTISGQTVSLDGVATGKRGVLVMFICNHCPFVKHIRDELAKIGREYSEKGIGIVAISSNDVDNFPADSPDLMKLEAREAGYVFPYLYDPTQEIAKAYKAACTPDFYLFDSERILIYRGQLDDSRPSKSGTPLPVTGADLRNAMEALLAGRPVKSEQRPSIGCNIKWKPGNEPEWWN